MAKEVKEKESKDKVREDTLKISESLAAQERPKTFGGIIGQKHIIAKMKGMIKLRKLPGTLLLHGPPGCGKTTLARVFARYVNCKTYDACGECPSCKYDIDDHPDILEINMAKATGKAEAEALIEKSRYMPRYNARVFILDEFHQVSSHAENVFLKPLEHPPAGTCWIICTSEVEKLKVPTLSRCLSLKVDLANVDELSARLQKISKREGLDLSSEGGLELTKTIANYSNGQIREAISLLQSVILAKAGDSKIDLQGVIKDFSIRLESSIDKSAVRTVVGFVKNNIKTVCTQASTVDSCRQLLMKMRWIAVSVIDEYTGTLKWESYNFREFKSSLKNADVKYNYKTLVPQMLTLLNILNTTEQRMNTCNVDERALFIGDLCHYMYSIRGKE